MMMNLKKNCSSPKRIPTSKPFIKFEDFIDPGTNAIFRKKAPKYVHNIDIREKALLVRRIKNCKTLRSIDLGDQNYEDLPRGLCRFHFDRIALKAFKPFHKYLKKYSIYDHSSQVEKPLQNLSVAQLSPIDDQYLKNNLRMINFEKIVFQFDPGYYSGKYETEEQKILSFLSRIRHRLVRHIRKLRKIKEIEMHLNSYSFKILAALVEILRQNPLLIPSLKNLKIITQKNMYPSNLEILSTESSHIQSILPYVTFLQTWNQKWVSTPVLFKNFRNIQELRINLSRSRDVDESTLSTQLPALKYLIKLRSFKLVLTSSRREIEKAFLESLTLSISIEIVEFILQGFEWKNGELTKKNKELVEKSFKEHPRYINFFNQWKNLPNLKELYLTMRDYDEERDSSSVCASFAIHIFKQLKTLTKVAFLNSASRPDDDPFSKTKTAVKPIKAIEFKNIWESLMPSRKTLEFVKIFTPGMNFAPSLNSIDTNLPKLEFFSLLGTVYWASEIFDFGRALWQHQKSNKNYFELVVNSMTIHDLKRLKLFFNSLQNTILTSLEAIIYLDTKELKGETWVDDFCEFMQKFKTGARICLTLLNVSITSYKTLQRVKSAVENNRSFYSFSMRCIKNDMFYSDVPKEGDGYDNTQYLINSGFVKMDT